MKEMNFCITDTAENFSNINYIYKTCHQAVKALGGDTVLTVKNQRSYFCGNVADGCSQIITAIFLDKVSDVIAINYKYNYFKKHLRTLGICDFEYELLLAALISADLKEDKRFVIANQKSVDNLPIDGLFNFILTPLRDKWAEVVSYIPTYFSHDKLCEFITYIINEKPKKCVTISGGRVYDMNKAQLCRGELMGYLDEASLVREVILSESSQIMLDGTLSGVEEMYLARFFGDKIFFKKGVTTPQKS